MAKSSKWKYLSSNLNLKVNIKGELKRIHRGSILYTEKRKKKKLAKKVYIFAC